MKNYTITVNGNVYEVTVEEGGAGSAPAAAPKAAPKAPAAAPKAAPAAAPKAAGGAQGSVKVSAPMPGKILSVKANVGDSVTKGQVIMVLEAMKMENEIVAPQDGTIASIDVAAGSAVAVGSAALCPQPIREAGINIITLISASFFFIKNVPPINM